MLQALVTGFSKAGIAVILNEAHLRKAGSQKVGTAISGMIIHHDRFHFQTCAGLANREKALLKKISNIIIDYDNRKFQEW